MKNKIISLTAIISILGTPIVTPAFAQTASSTQSTLGRPQILPIRPDGAYRGTVRCESQRNKYKQCKVRTDNRVVMQRQLAGNCTQGRTWGFKQDHIWVSGGCRANFQYGYANNAGGPYPVRPPQPEEEFAGTLRCESRSNRYQQCNVKTDNRVEMVRRLSGTCNRGRQWGFSASYIWVNNGCRADFRYGYDNLTPLPQPVPDRDKGPSTGLIIGGIVVAGGLLALLASRKKSKTSEEKTNEEAAEQGTYPAGPPAALTANLQNLPSASRPSVQNCLFDASRQIGVTGGSKLSFDKVISLEPGNGGWRIRAEMTATYPDGDRALEMYCRATPDQIIQLDFT